MAADGAVSRMSLHKQAHADAGLMETRFLTSILDRKQVVRSRMKPRQKSGQEQERSHEAGRLLITDRVIRQDTPHDLVRMFLRQWKTERRLARRGIFIRTSDPNVLEASYSRMTRDDFEGVNARQNWVNWRSIPRAMSGLVPDRPLTIVDLGCGIGSSTGVLAFYAPLGSRILAYEMSRPLVNIASTRAYLDRSGENANVRFHCQSITTPLSTFDSTPLGQSVDLASSSGVLGHHFNVDTMQLLAAQLKAVIRPGGLAMLDSGPTLSASDLAGIMASAGFVEVRRCHSWPLDPTTLIVFQSADTSP
jgi:SAM-dependent methyltransferase